MNSGSSSGPMDIISWSVASISMPEREKLVAMPPGRLWRSRMSTSLPSLASFIAQLMPASAPPITMTSYLSL